MENKRTCTFSFFRWDSPYGVICLFRLRHLTTGGGYLVCATPHTVLYRSIWNFAGSFVMVCRCDVVWHYRQFNFFVTFLTFELSHLWGLNTIKVHYRRYFVRATPPTALYWSIWNFACSLSWSVDVYVVLALLSISFLSLFLVLSLAIFYATNLKSWGGILVWACPSVRTPVRHSVCPLKNKRTPFLCSCVGVFFAELFPFFDLGS